MPMTKAPDRIGFYWEPVNDEPAEVLWVDYTPFLFSMTNRVKGDPIHNAYSFDSTLSHTLAELTEAVDPS